jgi:hypothetical protein
MQPKLSMRLSASAIALTASLAITACGGSHRSDTTAAPTANIGLQFAACVRAHGVPDYPDPGASSGRGSVNAPPGKVAIEGHILTESSQAVGIAEIKCQKYSPDTQFGPRYSATQMTNVRAGMLAMSKCMRARHINYPDVTVTPGPGGRGFALDYPKNVHIDYRSPAFNAANKTCSRLLDNTIPGKNG